MKIEQLIVQHLYNSKKLSLQDIGHFTLSQDITIPLENEKDFTLPENAITFESDRKAKQDDDLIDFIVTHSRKMKPLATSDLESYTLLARQFLNIGKPFSIEGLGVIQQNQQGSYDFSQVHQMNSKLEAVPPPLQDKREDEISFTSTGKEIKSNKIWIWPVMIISVIAIISLIFYFIKGSKKHEVDIPSPSISKINNLPIKDTAKAILPAKDSLAVEPVTRKDSVHFTIVLKEYYSKEAAYRAFNRLTGYGHQLLVYPKDSLIYKVAMPFTTPLNDTLRARDSLKILFGGRPYIEKI